MLNLSIDNIYLYNYLTISFFFLNFNPASTVNSARWILNFADLSSAHSSDGFGSVHLTLSVIPMYLYYVFHIIFHIFF